MMGTAGRLSPMVEEGTSGTAGGLALAVDLVRAVRAGTPGWIGQAGRVVSPVTLGEHRYPMSGWILR
jgi:hypothetical protein